MYVRQIGALDGESNRLGSRGEHERSPVDRASARKVHFAVGKGDRFCGIVCEKLDVVFAQCLGRAQRNPLFGSGAGEVVLGKIGPIDRARELRSH